MQTERKSYLTWENTFGLLGFVVVCNSRTEADVTFRRAKEAVMFDSQYGLQLDIKQRWMSKIGLSYFKIIFLPSRCSLMSLFWYSRLYILPGTCPKVKISGLLNEDSEIEDSLFGVL